MKPLTIIVTVLLAMGCAVANAQFAADDPYCRVNPDAPGCPAPIRVEVVPSDTEESFSDKIARRRRDAELRRRDAELLGAIQQNSNAEMLNALMPLILARQAQQQNAVSGDAERLEKRVDELERRVLALEKIVSDGCGVEE